MDGKKGGQVTKPVIVVKMSCELLYIKNKNSGLHASLRKCCDENKEEKTTAS